VDIPESDVGICWIYGNENSGEIYGENAHKLCMQKLKENSMEKTRDDFKDDGKK
jgi:hypothetical protein